MTCPPRTVAHAIVALVLCGTAALLGCDGGGDGGDTDVARLTTLAGGLDIGDGGPATGTFVVPAQVALDALGNVFVVDSNPIVMHSLVRRIDARTGTITTIGGPCDPYVQADPPEEICDLIGYGEIALNGDASELFVGGYGPQIFRVDPHAGALTLLAGHGGFNCQDTAGAPPTQTCIGNPVSLDLDANGSLVFGEIDAHDVGALRRLDAGFAELATLVPGAQAVDVTTARDGTLFFADFEHRRIDRIDPTSGAVTTFAGGNALCDGDRGDGGSAADACFIGPTGVAVANDGTLFVADSDRIRRIDGERRTIDTVAESTNIDDVAVAPDGTVVFTDIIERRVNRLEVATGEVTPVAGNGTKTQCGDGGDGKDACLGRPFGVAPAPDGGVFFADGDNGRLGRVDATGRVTTVVDHTSVGSCGDTGPHLDTCLADPSALVRDRDGTLYFADRGNDETGEEARPGRVRRFDPATGRVTTIAGNCTVPRGSNALESCVLRPSSLLLDGRGGLYVGGGAGVQRIDLASGTIAQVVGGGTGTTDCNADGIAAVDACVDGNDLAIDAAGNLYAIAFDQYRVRRIDAATGIVTTVAGNGTLLDCHGEDVPATSTCVFPNALVVDEGRLVIATDGVLRSVDLASGLISTVPGFTEAACGSVAPIPAGCVYPTDLAVDGDGRLVVAEPASRSIRRVTLP